MSKRQINLRLCKLINVEAAPRCVLKKKMFLENSQNSQEKTCARVSVLIKLTLAQVFSCEFYKFSKNTFFTEHLWTTASIFYAFLQNECCFFKK